MFYIFVPSLLVHVWSIITKIYLRYLTFIWFVTQVGVIFSTKSMLHYIIFCCMVHVMTYSRCAGFLLFIYFNAFASDVLHETCCYFVHVCAAPWWVNLSMRRGAGDRRTDRHQADALRLPLWTRPAYHIAQPRRYSLSIHTTLCSFKRQLKPHLFQH